MKKMKKILSAVLAIAMLMSMIVVPVSAEGTTETISVGETKQLTAEPNSTAGITFTAEESGNYILFDVNGLDFGYSILDVEANSQMYGEYWNHPNAELGGPTFKAEAGKTYLIEIYNYTETTVPFAVSVVKAEKLTEVALNYTEYVGYNGTTFYLSIEPTSDYAFETITWTSSDESVVNFGSGPNFGMEVICAAPGTATITATSESGLTATCVVTVKEMETITVGETKPISLAPGESAQFKFTPAESGRYIAYRPASDSFGMEFTDSTGEPVTVTQWFDKDTSFWGNAADLTAGEEYTIAVYNWNDNNSVNSALNLVKAEAIESFSFEKDSYTFFTGTYQDIHLNIEPYFGCEEVVYTSSNPAVAQIEGEDSMGVGLNLLEAGTSEITATSESGLTASCTVVVTEMPTLNMGDTPVTIPAEGSLEFSFTPAESGNFLFYIPDGIWNLGISAYEMETGNWVDGGDWQHPENAYYGSVFAMTAGTAYRVSLTNWLTAEQSFVFSAVKSSAYETLEFANIQTCYVGSSVYLRLIGTPEFAVGNVTWTNSNPDVAELDWSSNTGANLMGLAAGTTTVTATTDNGLSVSCEVTVKDMESIEVGETVTLEIPYDGSESLKFTPAEDGTYIIHYPATDYFGLNCIDENYNWYNGAEWSNSDETLRGTAFTLQGGNTYTVEVNNWNVEGIAQLELTVTKAVPYTSLAFTQDSFTGYVSGFQSVPIYLDCAPEYGGEELICTSSNTAVVESGWISGDCLYLQAHSAGTATITIATADGRLEDTCTVTIKDPIVLSHGQEEGFAIDPMGYAIFSFTPASAGTYSFYCVDNDYFGYSVFDSNGNWIETSDRWTNNALISDIDTVAGETYYISFHSNKEVEDTYQLGIGQSTTATGMSVDVGSGEVYLEDSVYLLPNFAPVLATTETVTWKSSNENVIKFVEVNTEYDVTYYVFDAVGLGTATLTATSENGLTTTCKITVIAPDKIELGTHSVTVPAWEYVKYEFTAEEAGTYVIYDEDPDSLVGWILGEDSTAVTKSYEDGEKVGTMITLAAGETAWPAVQSNTDEEKTFTFTFEQGAHEHSLTLVPAVDATYTAPGNIEHYACACGKMYADANGTTELTEEDVVIPVLTPAASGECGDDLTWILDDEGTVIISGTGPMWDYDDPMMEGATNLNPWLALNIKKVIVNEGATTIGASAFSGCESMTEVILPEGITSIGDAAFSFTAITAIDLPDTLTTLGGGVFNETELTSIVIPEGVTSVGGYLFTYTPSLTEVILPSTLTTIPDYMFYGCGAKSIHIPEGVTAIGESAFENCSIESVTLPSTLVEIGVGAFRSSALKSITIPGSVKVVPAAFFGSALEEVVICEGVEEIEAWAFGSCFNLKKVTIPASVKTIGVYAFQHNADGAEYHFLGDAPVTFADDGEPVQFFDDITGTAYYPVDNATWTEEVMASLVSENTDITWVSYGSHALELVPAKDPTYTAPGNIEHYGCTKCDKVFADAEGNTELPAEDVTIPQLIVVEDTTADVSKEAIDNAVQDITTGGEVKIPVADAGENVESAALPVESLTQVADKEASLTLEMSAATVTMDTAALAAVVTQSGDNATVTLEVTQIEEEELTEAQQEALQDKNVFAAISAQLLVDGQPIASESAGGFGGGKVTVKIPFTPDPGTTEADYSVLYIADDGTAEEIATTYEEGYLVLVLEHFSDYVILKNVDILLGDVNGDGQITVLDLMRLANHFANSAEISAANADVNGDGSISVLDLMRLANYFAGKSTLG